MKTTYTNYPKIKEEVATASPSLTVATALGGVNLRNVSVTCVLVLA